MKKAQTTKDQTSRKSEKSSQDQVLDRSRQAQNIIKSLRIIIRSIQAHSRVVQQESDVTSAQLWILWEIFNSSGIKVTELAKVLSVHQSTCSNILDKLQKKGLIRRDRSGTDQRVVQLYLTDKGAQLLANAPKPAQGAVTEVLERLPDAALKNMEESLATFIEAMHFPVTDTKHKPLDL